MEHSPDALEPATLLTVNTPSTPAGYHQCDAAAKAFLAAPDSTLEKNAAGAMAEMRFKKPFIDAAGVADLRAKLPDAKIVVQVNGE